jgi:hypothetical protein
MKNKFISRLLSLVTIIVLLYSCRNELSTEQEEAHSNSSQFRPTSKTIRLEQSKHKLVLKTELQKVQENLKEIKTNASGKAIDYANGVSIDTDNVTYIEYGTNFHTYTFNLVRENSPESAPLENLVLSYLPDGSYKELLVTYNFTSQEKQDLLSRKGVKTAGKATAIELAKGTYGGIVSNRSMGGAESCSYKTVDMYFSCYTGEHHQGNESSWGECNWQNKGGYAAQHITVVALVCTADTSLGIDGSPGGGDIGPTTGLGGGTDTPTIPTLSRFFFYVKKLPVDLKTVIYDTANTEFYDGFKNYYDANYGSAEAEEFITWALQFKQNNPNTSWYQFENWFLKTNEGLDGDYDSAYWDNPNLSFPAQSLPNWNEFAVAYPKHNDPNFDTPEKMYQAAGNAIFDTYLTKGYRNTCALRISYAINHILGPDGKPKIKIPPSAGFKGNDGNYYFLSATALLKWMKATFGTPSSPYHISGSQGGQNGANFPSIMSNLPINNGIYIMIPNTPGGCPSPANPQGTGFCASGHADLIHNGVCDGGCYFGALGGVKEIFVWPLQ